MKKICIVVKNAKLIQRYFLRSGLFDLLGKNGNIGVVVLVPEGEEKTYKNEFKNNNVEIVSIPLLKPTVLYRLLIWISKSQFYEASCVRGELYKKYRLRLGLFKTYTKILTGKAMSYPLFLRKIVQSLVCGAVGRLGFQASVRSFLEEYKPDLVLGTSLHEASFDLPVLVEARRKKIKTAGMVRVWSALGPTSFLAFKPDYFIVQNEFQKKMLLKYNFYKHDKIINTGFPYMDWFKKDSVIIPRKFFLKSLGIDPNSRLVLYAASGEGFPGRDVSFAETLEKFKDQGLVPKEVVFVLRLHPYHASFASEMQDFKSRNLKSFMLDDVPAGNLKAFDRAEDDRSQLIKLANLIYHSDLCITSGGTIVLEVAAFDKPMILLVYDGMVKTPYWLSLARKSDGTFLFWEDIIKKEGMSVVRSDEELIDSVNKYLKNPETDGDGRRNLRHEFVEPLDGQSTQRLASCLISLVAGDL